MLQKLFVIVGSRAAFWAGIVLVFAALSVNIINTKMFSSKSIAKRTYKIFLLILVFISTIILILNFLAPRIYIFGFHTVIDPNKVEDRPFLTSAFKDMNYLSSDIEILLDYLVARNFWFLSTQELYDYFITHAKKIPPEHLGQKPVMLSFDDGYKNIYTNLLPILEKLEYKYGHKVKVVIFANPGTLADYESNSSYHMTCKDLREGLEKGFYDIQSHGLNHKNLTEIDTYDLINEVLKAQVELRRCTADLDPSKLVAAHIAYPYGATNEQVQEYVSRYYLSSYLYNSKIMKIDWLSDQYHIPRLTVNWQKPPSKLIRMAARSSELVKKG